MKNLEDSKKKGNEVTKENYSLFGQRRNLLSFCDHFMLTYLKCCVCGRIKKISTYYEKIDFLVTYYTDILSISNNIFELEKLKYLLLDEDQVSLFNYRMKLNVKSDLNQNSKYADYYYFTKSLNDDINLGEIQHRIRNRNDNKFFNKRLADLVERSTLKSQ